MRHLTTALRALATHALRLSWRRTERRPLTCREMLAMRARAVESIAARMPERARG